MSSTLVFGLCLIGIGSAVVVLLRSEDPELESIGKIVTIYLVILPALVTGVAMVVNHWLSG